MAAHRHRVDSNFGLKDELQVDIAAEYPRISTTDTMGDTVNPPPAPRKKELGEIKLRPIDGSAECKGEILAQNSKVNHIPPPEKDALPSDISNILARVISCKRDSTAGYTSMGCVSAVVDPYTASVLFKILHHEVTAQRNRLTAGDGESVILGDLMASTNFKLRDLVVILTKAVKHVQSDPIEKELDLQSGHPKIENYLNRATSGLYCAAALLVIYSALSKFDTNILAYTRKLENIFPEDVLSICIDITNYCLTYTTGGICNWDTPRSHGGGTQLRSEGILASAELESHVYKFFESLLIVLKTIKSLIEEDLLDEEKCGSTAFSCIFILTNVVPDSLGGSAIQACQYKSLEICSSVFSLKTKLRKNLIEELCLNIAKIYTSTKSVNRGSLVGGAGLDLITNFLLGLAQTCSSPSKKMLELASLISQKFNRIDTDEVDLADIEEIIAECDSRVEGVFQCVYVTLSYIFSKVSKNSQESEARTPEKKGGDTKKVFETEFPEEEYKEVFGKIIDTVLNLFTCLEWPAVDFFATAVCKILLPIIDDANKSVNFLLKHTAFQWFGEIAKKILSRYSGQGYFGDNNKSDQERYILNNALNYADVKQDSPDSKINVLWILQREALLEAKNKSSPQKLMAISWISVMGKILLSSPTKNPLLLNMICEFCTVINDTWDYNDRPASLDISVIPDSYLGILYFLDNNTKRRFIRDYATFYSSSTGFAKDVVLCKIFSALASEIAPIRCRALKILQEIYISNRELVNIETYESHLEKRVLDRSISVREAAVDFLGRIILDRTSNNLESAYLSLSKRVLDIGLSVRRKVLKVLKDIYLSEYKSIYLNPGPSSSLSRKTMLIDSARKILGRIKDSESVIKVRSYQDACVLG